MVAKSRRKPGKTAKTKQSLGIDENLLLAICYFFGVLGGIVTLVLAKDDKKLKFHALQSIILGVVAWVAIILTVWFIIGLVLIPLYWLYAVYLAYLAYTKQEVKVPIVYKYAEEMAEG